MKTRKQTWRWLLKKFDRVTKKFVANDFVHVLMLNLDKVVTPRNNDSSIGFQFLDSAEVAQHSDNPHADLGDDMPGIMEQQDVRCFAALDGNVLLGYAWVAEGTVAPEHNTGGERYKGLGLELEPHVSYLFKCFVLPEHRGRGINQQVLWHLSQQLMDEGKQKLVTTTSWVNRAFQSSSRRIGFKRIGRTGEWKLLGKRYFWWSELPKFGVEFFKPRLTA